MWLRLLKMPTQILWCCCFCWWYWLWKECWRVAYLYLVQASPFSKELVTRIASEKEGKSRLGFLIFGTSCFFASKLTSRSSWIGWGWLHPELGEHLDEERQQNLLSGALDDHSNHHQRQHHDSKRHQQNLLSCALNALQDFCQFLRLCLLAFLSKEEWEEFADWSKRRPPLYSAAV